MERIEKLQEDHGERAAEKEKAVKALLASERWRGLSDEQIAREAAVARTFVLKLRKISNQVVTVTTSNATSKATRLGKDGKRYPATRAKPAAAAAPPLPSLRG